MRQLILGDFYEWVTFHLLGLREWNTIGKYFLVQKFESYALKRILLGRNS